MTRLASSVKPKLFRVLHCPLCHSSRQEWDLDAVAFGSGPYAADRFSIYECRVCGLGITDPVPSQDDSRLLYEGRDSYDFHVDDSPIGSALKRVAANRDVRAFGLALDQPQTGEKMLDYACGNGSFAAAMSRVFPCGSVWATDYHLRAPAMLLQQPGVSYAPYERIAEHGPFDFVLCRHVLEHTYDPVAFLQHVGVLLRSGGILVVEVPNLKAPLRRIFGMHWDNYYAPFHPMHFSQAALRRAVVQAGFAPVKFGGSEMPKIGRSLQNILNCDYNLALFGVGVLCHPLQFVAQYITGEATNLRVWARKV
jgi:SAM-dependent methyltransferase